MAWYAPYRVPLLREVAREHDIQLTVVYCSPIEKDREWMLKGELPFSSIFLEPRTIARYQYRRLFGQTASLDYPKGLVRTLQRLSPQVVISYEYHLESLISAVYAGLKRCAYVTWSDVTALHDERMGRIRMIMRKILLARSAALIASSSDTINHLCTGFGFPRSRAFLSILSSHWEEFAKGRVHTRALRADQDTFRLLFVGRLLHLKGLDTLIKAFASFTRSFPQSRLTIVGNGPELSSLKLLARRQRCENIVEFKEYVPHDQMASEMASHDVFVLPTRLDVFGLVVAEAMACGLPVICSRNAGAANDLVKDNGILVHPDRVEELAAAMTLLATQPTLRSRMSAAARRVLEKHNMESAKTGFVNAIRTAADHLMRE
jgi:glycosyltransferase involved in cell wall biosynthesis